MACAPPSPSSAGWKMSCTVPAKSGSSARTFAAPSSIAVCPSCPQACIRPGVVDAYGSDVCSTRASASMSARKPIAPWPGRLPRKVPTTPKPPTCSATSMPQSRSFCATRADVRRSSRPSSGWAWMSRRIATTSGRTTSIWARTLPSIVPSLMCQPASLYRRRNTLLLFPDVGKPQGRRPNPQKL